MIVPDFLQFLKLNLFFHKFFIFSEIKACYRGKFSVEFATYLYEFYVRNETTLEHNIAEYLCTQFSKVAVNNTE